MVKNGDILEMIADLTIERRKAAINVLLLKKNKKKRSIMHDRRHKSSAMVISRTGTI